MAPRLPGESIKGLAFENLLLLNIKAMILKNYLVLFPICPVRFTNLTDFNRPFLPVKMGDFLQKAPFKHARTSENNKEDFHLLSSLAIMTHGCVHEFFLIGEWNPPE